MAREYKSTFTGSEIDLGIKRANSAVQPEDLATVATTGNYNDLENIPSEVTDSTVSGWGFIKNNVDNLVNYYDKNDIDSKISSVYKYKGTVQEYSDLPDTDLTIGDVYNIETEDTTHEIKAGDNVAWTGTAWDKLAGEIDLSGKMDKHDPTGDGTFVFGTNNTAGSKAFSITDIKGTTGTRILTLDSVTGLSVGDVCSAYVKDIQQQGGNDRTDNFDAFGTITAINGLDVTFNGGFTWSWTFADSYLWVIGKPELGTIDIGNNAMAFGNSVKAQQDNTFALGRDNVASGKNSVALGRQNEALGYCSTTIGRNNKASGKYSFASGRHTEATGMYAHAEGQGSNASKVSASGQASHAEGFNTKAQGTTAHSEGNNTIASGNYSHSEGNNTVASGSCSHAEGYGLSTDNPNTASGTGSHAEGYNTKSTATATHAEGYGTQATGTTAHAEGNNTQANGNYSHAEGNNTIADGTFQHVAGKYNVPDTTSARITGWGSSSERKNIEKLTSGGDLYLAGDVYSKNNNKLVSKSDIGFDNNGNLSVSGNVTSKGKQLISLSDIPLATDDNVGLVKTGSYGTKANASGRLYCNILTYENYQSSSNNYFIAKGTLENVLVGKGLVDVANKQYVDDKVKDATLTIQKNGTTINTFSANASSDKTINIEVPTDTSDLTNNAGYTTNKGTITGITMNGSSKGTSGVVDLGNVITAHQDISGKVDKVTGKGLSTNDYTDADKLKLSGIDMSTKQDTLVSGTNIKTVNGKTILGSGNVETVDDGQITVMKLGADTTSLITRGSNLMGHKANVLYKLPKPVGPTGITTLRATMQDGKIFDNTTTGGGTDHECLLRILFWDENKEYVNYYTCKTGNDVKEMAVGSLSKNCYYLSWNVDTDYYGRVMVNYGDVSLPYEDYKYEELTDDEYVEIQKNILYDYVTGASDKIKYDPYLPDVWTPGTIDSTTGYDKLTDLTTEEQYRFFSPTYIDLQDVEELKLIKLHTDWQMAPFFYTAGDGKNSQTSTLIEHPDNGVYTAYDRTWSKKDFNGARFVRIGGRRQNDKQQSGGHNEQYCKYFQIVITRKKRPESYESELYFSEDSLAQGSTHRTKGTSGLVTTDTTAVSTQDILGIPYLTGLKVKVHIDGGYEVTLALGNKPTYMLRYANQILNKLYSNGDIIDIPTATDIAFYRVEIRKRKRCSASFATYYDLTPAEAAKANLHFEIISEPLRKLNKETAEKQQMIKVRTAQYHTRYNVPGATYQSEKNTFKNPLIVHVSDLHGDYKRLKNAYDFAEDLKPALFVNSGDTVAYDFSSGSTWIKDLIKGYDLPQVIAIGNHDVYPSMDATKTGDARFVPVSDTDVYNNIMSGVETELGNTTNKLYYYRDLPDSKLRVIVTCLYEAGGAINSEKVRKYTHLKLNNGVPTQLAWFADRLRDTPAGYGIVVVQHSLQDIYAPSEGYTTFFHPLSDRSATAPQTDGYNHIYESDGTTMACPFYDIVDAFISKTTLTKTYKQEAQSGSGTATTLETFSVNYDMSTYNEGVEFVAWLSGHLHHDTVHYVTGTQNLQLELNINTSAAIYGAVTNDAQSYPYFTDGNEQARYKNEDAEDVINVYGIDREDKTVKIVRIGNNWTYDMNERSYMEIPYASS